MLIQEAIVEELGEFAIKGLTPTTTKIVFTEDDFQASCGTQTLDTARVMGIICKKGENSWQYFHKTGQEYCCGRYLSNRLQPERITHYLESLKTPKDVLSVAPVLTFAASSKITAKAIIEKLLSIFRSHVPYQDYYDEKLAFGDALTIQQYIEVCLRCNFEADAETELTSTLAGLFPDRKVLLYGVSSSAATSLAHYITHCDQAISKVKLRPVAHAKEPGVLSGPELKVYNDALKNLKYHPDEQIQQIRDAFIASNPDLHVEWTRIRTPAQLVAYISCIQACEGLVHASETNIVPIIRSFRHIQLEYLSLDCFKLDDDFDCLLESIENGDMQYLTELHAKSVVSRERQMTRLVSSLNKMPQLRFFSIPQNKAEAGQTIPILADNLAKFESLRETLQVLHVSYMQVPAHDMEILARNLPPHLIDMGIHGNEMNDATALHLINTLPQTLIRLYLSMNHLSVGKHSELLNSIHSRLTRLQLLYVRHSSYTRDLMEHGTQILTKCTGLETLLLHSTSNELMPRDRMEVFMERLQQAKNIKNLQLPGIRLDKETFEDLVGVCKRKSLEDLR